MGYTKQNGRSEREKGVKKRAFCGLLAALCALFLCAPVMVFAAPEEGIDLDFTSDASGSGWSWNAARRTLSLSSFSIRNEDTYAFRLPPNSTILYSGDCAITSARANAIESSGMLTILSSSSASGSLEVYGGKYAVLSDEVILYGNGITLRGETAAVSGSAETEGGYALWVFSGGAYVDAPYRGEQALYTGRLYPVYVQSDAGGAVSFSYANFAPGATVDLRAYAKEGYLFGSWTGNAAFSNANGASTSFVMPDHAVRVKANFTRVYTLSISKTEGGYVTQDTPGGAFEPGTTVLVYAVANTGYYFSHWTSDYGAFRDPLQAYAAFTMPNIDATLTPVFVAGESYTLTVGRVGEGWTNVTLANLPEGRRIYLSAVPSEGYVFSGWLSDGGYFSSSEEAACYFTMPGANANVTAVFAATDALKSTVTVNARTGGNVNLTGGSFVPGVTVELSAAPKTGYRFVSWEADDVEHLKFLDDPFQPDTVLIVPPEDITIYARFELLDPDAVTFYCAVGATEGGTVQSEGTGYYIAGYELDLTAIPDEGYYFAGWVSAVGGKFASAADESTVFKTPANDTKVLARFRLISEANEQKEGGIIVTPTDPDDLSPGSVGARLPILAAIVLTVILCVLSAWNLTRSGLLGDLRRALHLFFLRRRRKRLRAKREV